MSRFAVIVAVLVFAGCTTVPTTVQPVNDAHVREHPEQYLVLAVKNDADASYAHAGSTVRGYDSNHEYAQSARARKLLKEIAVEYQLESIDSWPIQLLAMQCVIFKPVGTESGATLINKLQRDPRVLLAQPLQNFSTNSTPANPEPDSYQSLQQSLRRMDIVNAHRWSRGRGINVAVIDTGMDINHPDLKGRITEQRNLVDDDQQQFARDRHGTAVAGVIAADASNASGIIGIAPEANLIALKACWQLQANRDDARCNTFTLAKGIANAVQLHAQIINLSVVGPDDALLTALVKQAQRAGIVIVGAKDASDENRFPASLPDVIGVSSMELREAHEELVSAPGRDVLTLLPGGRYDFASGNSIATAEVTGTIALLMARDKHNLDSAQLKKILLQNTESSSIDNLASINACRALSQLLGQPGCDHSRIDSTSTAKSIAQ
ncbi:MAG TPA: S8 family serine peptidase [Steroidobacteraceae bacterium]|nr:S8 family serine peptidase [Steroidobacteraceae bacterium]